jgi:hypothetical protein
MGYFSGQKSKFVGRVEVTKPDRNPQLLGFTSFNPTYAKRATCGLFWLYRTCHVKLLTTYACKACIVKL